jgi:hypothetical protein
MHAAAHNAPIVIGSSQAQQQALHELDKSKYHLAPRPSSSPTPSTATPSPPPANPPAHSDAGTIVLVVLAIILALTVAALLLFWLGHRSDRKTGRKKRRSGRKRSEPTALDGLGEVLTGAAVVATLDERGLLPERPERTADEAAADAGVLLPVHATVLASAARAFDEVQYGEYQGTEEGYRLISSIYEAVSTPGTPHGSAATRAQGA